MMDMDDHCQHCGAVIMAEGLAWSKLYCGARCYADAVLARKRKTRAAARAHLRCAWCAGPMQAARADRKYCCARCREAAWRDYHRERLRDYQREYQRARRAARKAPGSG